MNQSIATDLSINIQRFISNQSLGTINTGTAGEIQKDIYKVFIVTVYDYDTVRLLL